MAHIHTGPGEHDLTVSAFIVRTTDGIRRLLVHRHKTLGVMLQPGGHVELTENPWQAIAHELMEETGYDLSQLWVLQPEGGLVPNGPALIHPQPVSVRTFNFGGESSHFHIDLSWAFVASEDPKGHPGEGESEELIWLTAAELADLENTYEDVRATGLYVLNTLMDEWKPRSAGAWSLDDAPAST